MPAVHADPVALFARMLRRTVRNESGCWIFTGCTNTRGYSQVSNGRKGGNILGHQLAVIARDGSIPDGMTVDHRCHNSSTCTDPKTCPHLRCVNPSHLVVMTNAGNVGRRWESGLCRKGHPLERRRKDGRRECPTCKAAYMATYFARRAA